MAHRAQYSTTEVLELLDESNDLDEPFMDGSDEEFDAWQTDDEYDEGIPTERDTVQVNEHISPPHSPKQLHINNPSLQLALLSHSLEPPHINNSLSQLSLPPQSSHINSLSSQTALHVPQLSLESPQMNNSPMQQALQSQFSDQSTVNNSSMQLPHPPETAHADTWSSQLNPLQMQQFSERVGPTFTMPDTPLGIFSKFFTDDFLESIVFQSNLYASQVMSEESFSNWHKISLEELKAYFGFYILMGINRLPSLDDYWKLDSVFHYKPIADRITRQRFREISRYLHFTNNMSLEKKGEPGYDKLGKVRPIMEHCSQVFYNNYLPNCQLAIDEAMIPFQGRSTMKQYMPLKPTKRGLKVWVRADSCTGYFCEYDVYTGKGNDDIREFGLGGSVVIKLTRKIVGKYHQIFTDNFFTSVPLFIRLYNDKIYACGTIRVNRKGWPTILKDKSKRNRQKLNLNNR